MQVLAMKKSYNFSDDINDVSSFPYIETYFFAAIQYLFFKSFFLGWILRQSVLQLVDLLRKARTG
jgi:hypothetical protein